MPGNSAPHTYTGVAVMSIRKKCFVVSAIGQPGTDERKHADLVLNYIIKPVAESAAGYEVTRGDESSHSGMITVDAINLLMEADLVIADLSFLNPNVFYELGLRHSTNLPTIHIATQETEVPFDNAGHRVIQFDISDWHSHERARAKLTDHIAAIAPDHVTNPVTIAQAYKKGKELQSTIRQVSSVLDLLENRINKITNVPEKIPITKGRFEEVTQKHRDEILEIVHGIRHRIDVRMTVADAETLPHAKSMLTRLQAIEDFISTQKGIHFLPAMEPLVEKETTERQG